MSRFVFKFFSVCVCVCVCPPAFPFARWMSIRPLTFFKIAALDYAFLFISTIAKIFFNEQLTFFPWPIFFLLWSIHRPYARRSSYFMLSVVWRLSCKMCKENNLLHSNLLFSLEIDTSYCAPPWSTKDDFFFLAKYEINLLYCNDRYSLSNYFDLAYLNNWKFLAMYLHHSL